MNYERYLRSEHWQEVKRRYRASDLPQGCHICGVAKVDLHHKTYKRLGKERLTDLLPLCREHHWEVHELVKKRKNRSKWNNWSAPDKLKKKVAPKKKRVKISQPQGKGKRARLAEENDQLHERLVAARERRERLREVRAFHA